MPSDQSLSDRQPGGMTRRPQPRHSGTSTVTGPRLPARACGKVFNSLELFGQHCCQLLDVEFHVTINMDGKLQDADMISAPWSWHAKSLMIRIGQGHQEEFDKTSYMNLDHFDHRQRGAPKPKILVRNKSISICVACGTTLKQLFD